MKKILTIAAREYLTGVKTKSFMIGLFLTPIIIIAAMVLPYTLQKSVSQKPKNLAVVDLSGEIYPELKTRMDEYNKNSKRQYVLQERKTAPEDVDKLKDTLKTETNAGKLDAYLIIGQNIVEDGAGSRYFSKNITDIEMTQTIRNILRSVVVNRRFIRSGMDPNLIAKLQGGIGLEEVDISAKGKEKKARGMATMMTGFAFMFLLFMAVNPIGGQAMLNSVMEEKSSRIFEVLLSSVSPFQLMVGKILGIGATSLTVVGIWSVSGYAVATYRGLSDLIPLSNIGYFLIYFILGFLLISSIMGAMGSTCNTIKEAQNLIGPITIMTVIPMFIWLQIAQNPHGLLAIVLSYIPTFTPFIMMIRLSVSPVPSLEILISILLLIVSVIIAMWASARIFRVGVLMYGKPPKIKEIIKWLRYE